MVNRDNEKSAGADDQSRVPSFDEYFSMNEQEKDRAIEQTVLRLQNRVRQILYLMEIERNPVGKPSAATRQNNPPRKKQ